MAGRTFTLECGERRRVVVWLPVGLARLAFVEEVEEALEWEWTWWMERTLERDEEVDFLPRRPETLRR